jgi:hypothetical protein
MFLKELSMFHIPFPRASVMAAAVASLLLVSACGGGGSTSLAVVGSGGTGFVGGTVTKGPVNGATVTAYGVSGGVLGAMVGTTTTDANGNFSVNIGAYSGAMALQASGGSYRDEATGTAMPMASGDVMTAVMPMVAAGSNVTGIQVTPVTAMAQELARNMAGGMTDANIAIANAAMGNYFAVSDILHVQPMNPLSAGSGAAANTDARNYGMTLAAMSQYAKSLNMPYSSAVITAMMSDAADGMMDGKRNGAPISMGMAGMMGSGMMTFNAGTSSLATAMTDFMNSSANASGLRISDMTQLMQKLNASSGRL